jgi:hypothetical protein
MNLKLFKIIFDNSIKEVYSRLTQNLYTEDEEKGFFVDKFINKKIEGRFFYKKIFSESVNDPFGKIIVNEFVIYDSYNFIIDDNNKVLLLFDSPKDVKIFLSSLNVLFNYKITLDVFNIDLLNLAFKLARVLDDFKVVFLEIDGISFSNLTSGKVFIRGEENILKYIDHATYHNKNYKVKKIAFKFSQADSISRIEMSNSGVVKFPQRNSSLIRETIARIISDYL